MALTSTLLALLMTFTRASTATYINDLGVMVSAAVDVRRIDYDPATLEDLGLLIEPARTNLALHSAAPSNAAYSKTGLTPAASAEFAPDGTTAEKLTEDSSTGVHNCQQTINVVAGQVYSRSLYVKAGDRFRCGLGFGGTGFGTYEQASFDLVAMTKSNIGASLTNVEIVDAGNGWRRLTLSRIATVTGTAIFRFNMQDVLGVNSYTGSGTHKIYYWGEQFEAGAYATSHIPTTTAAVTRAADDATVTLGSWWNGMEGTIVIEAKYHAGPADDPGMRVVAQIDDGTGSNAFAIYNRGGTTHGWGVFRAGLPIAFGTGAAATTGYAKAALAFKRGSFAAAVDGVIVGTGASGALPLGLTTLRIGHYIGGKLGGHIGDVDFHPYRASNDELIALTS